MYQKGFGPKASSRSVRRPRHTSTYEVINPGVGDLSLLVECCGAAAHLADEIAWKVNTNQFTRGPGGSPEDEIKKQYVSEGKCSTPGALDALTRQGNATCNYLYNFKNKAWKEYAYTSMCVPSDVCAVDVAGSTKGLKLTYTVVLQILNKQAGDLIYAGEGPIGSCLTGMNTVNRANISGFKKEVPNYLDILGTKIQVGSKEVVELAGMKQLDPLEMLSPCKNISSTGVLYIFKNKFWNKDQSFLNITDYDQKAADQEMKEDYKALMEYPVPGQEKAKPEKKEKKAKAPKDRGLSCIRRCSKGILTRKF